jgi:hypothetical protein
MTIHIPFNTAEAKENGFCITGTSGSDTSSLAKHILRFLLQDGCFVYVISESKAWAPPAQTPITNAIALQPHGIVTFQLYQDHIFDVSKLDNEERFVFVDELCKKVIDSRADAPNPKLLPWLFVVFGEARLYLPKGCMRSPRKYGNVLDLVSNGHNLNVRFGLITQFPAMVDKAAFKITQQRYFGSTADKNDVNYIKSFLNSKNEVEYLRNLGKLEFIYQRQGKTEKLKVEPFGFLPLKSGIIF